MNANNSNKQGIELWFNIIGNPSPRGMLHLAMQHTAHSLTDMVGRTITAKSLRIKTVPISYLMGCLDDPEAETVGIYLRLSDDLPGQAILILSPEDGMYLADWLLEERPGTSTRLGPLEYSALAELGNLTLSSFLNTLANFTGSSLRPSSPAMMVDMLAAILEVVVTNVAAVADDLLIIETDFVNVESALWIRFWVLPDPAVLTKDRVKPAERQG